MVLRACVDGDLPDYMEVVLEWMDPLMREFRIDDQIIKKNNKVKICSRQKTFHSNSLIFYVGLGESLQKERP